MIIFVTLDKLQKKPQFTNNALIFELHSSPLVPAYLSRGPPVLQHPERVVPLSECERFEPHFQPNVALAPIPAVATASGLPPPPPIAPPPTVAPAPTLPTACGAVPRHHRYHYHQRIPTNVERPQQQQAAAKDEPEPRLRSQNQIEPQLVCVKLEKPSSPCPEPEPMDDELGEQVQKQEPMVVVGTEAEREDSSEAVTSSTVGFDLSI